MKAWLAIIALLPLTGMTCAPRVTSERDVFIVAYEGISSVAKTTRTLCGAAQPDPCTGVLPTDVRDDLKEQMVVATAAVDAAKDRYLSDGDASGLGAALTLVEALKAAVEVYK